MPREDSSGPRVRETGRVVKLAAFRHSDTEVEGLRFQGKGDAVVQSHSRRRRRELRRHPFHPPVFELLAFRRTVAAGD